MSSHTQRTSKETYFLATPFMFGAILLFAVAVLAIKVWLGGAVTGPVVEFSLTGSCAAASEKMVRTRIEAIGLGEPSVQIEGSGLKIKAQFPDLPDALETIPAMLGSQGMLEIKYKGSTLVKRDDLLDAAISLDEGGIPYVALKLKSDARTRLSEAVEKDPQGFLDIHLDGKLIVHRPNTAKIPSDELKVISEQGDSRARMRKAADRSIVLRNGPLSCALRVEGLRNLSEVEKK